jgi:hypothetical protein
MRSSVAKTALVGNICMGLARSAKDMRGFEMLTWRVWLSGQTHEHVIINLIASTDRSSLRLN